MRTIYQQMLIALLALIPVGAWAQTTFTQGDFTYTVTDEENHKVSIAKAAEVSLTGALVIPTSVTEAEVTYAVTAVGDDGFKGTEITSVTIPASVTSIGENAFMYCNNLSTITLPSGLITIGASAFDTCNSLTGILTIPASVTTIGNRAFSYTGFTGIVIEDSASPLTISSDSFYSPFADMSDTKTLYLGRNLTYSNETDYNPFGDLSSVEIGSQVTTIRPYMFNSASHLARVIIGSGVTSIGDYAFQSCGTFWNDETNQGVEEMEVTMGSNVVSIGSNAFMYCSKLRTIALPSGLITIGASAFDTCPNLTGILTIPASVTTIGDRAFSYTGFSRIVIADNASPLTISSDSFYSPFADMSDTKTLYLGRNLTFSNEDDYNPFGNLSSVEIGSQVTTIRPYMFNSASHLANVIIGSGVTTIGDAAFYSCSALTSVTIPASVQTIGNQVFYYVDEMKNFTIEDGNTLLTIGDLGWGISGENFYLGRDVTYNSTLSGQLVFSNAQHVTIGPNVTTLNNNMFYERNRIKSVDLTQATSLTTIGDNVFYHCDSLENITIPATVTSIGYEAFLYTDRLNNVIFEDGDATLTMDSSIGSGLCGQSMYLGRNISGPTTRFVWTDCKTLTVGPKVTTLYANMFKESALETVDMSNSGVTTIGAKAFFKCDKLESIDLGDKLESLGGAAFSYTGLKSIEIPASLKKLPGNYDTEGLFEDCHQLTTVILHEGLEEIGSTAFYDCDALTEITIPASVKKIGRAPFYCNSVSAMKRMIIADSDTPLEFDNGTSEVSYGRGNLTDDITLDYLYLGRDVNRVYFENSLAYNAKEIEIGPKVTTISGTNGLFYLTEEVESVKVHALTPFAINDDDFHSSTYENATLQVPGGTKEAYTTANGWKKFTNIAHWSTLVTLTASDHGSIATAEATASNGTEQYRQPKEDAVVYTLTADEGYELTALTDNDAAVSPLPALGEAQTRTNASGEEFVTLNATFSAITYTLNYELAGGSVASANPTTYTIESAAITLNNPTREGYNFTGWKLNGEGDAMMEVIIAKGSTGDKSYTATWTPIIYSIALTLDGGTAENPSTYTIESAAITLTNPTKTGYTFKGWKLNGEGEAMMEVIIAKGSTGDKAYTATWQINQYTITFDSNGGTGIDAIKLNYGTEVEAPANPTRTGYTFAGWKPEVPATIPAENMTCVAQWTINQYTITFNTAGGSVVDPITQDYATAVVAPANPTREGYTFAGWDSEIPETMPAENVTINATWTPVTYNISYDLAGGAFAVQDDVVLNINATTGAWTATNANGTWASKWESTSNNPHVKFIASGNNMSFYDGTNIQCFNTYGGTTTNTNYLIQAPEGWYITRVNFDFVANSANGVAVTLNGNQSAQSLSTTDTKHLEATNICKNEVIMNVAMVNANSVFAQLTNFVVELTAHPTAYTIESGAFTIENPTKDGYDFAGWTGTGLEDATKDVTIATGSTGDRSYTATWTAMVYAVSITGGGVTADNMAPKYGDNVTITIEEDEDRELNTLTVNGVDVTASVEDGQYTIANVTGNVVVVATFNSTKEFITLPASSDYATFSCSQDLDFSEVSGLKAYIASGFDKTTGTVLLTRVESVPAETGLLLRGTAGETYKVPYAESASYYVNMLKPVPTATTIAQTEGDYTNYFLGKQGDPEVIGFYKGKTEGTAVSAQKAYLQLPTSAVAGTKSIGIYFDDTTGVGEVKASTMAPEGVYDIHGRKIPAGQKLTRGIYIINGKKVSIK